MKISIIGLGVMGNIFLQTAEKLKLEITTSNKNSDNSLAVENADVIVIAVKPQQFFELADLKGKIKDSTLVLSVMAGVKIEKIQDVLGVKKVVRTMPNLGARIGKSMTAWTCSDQVSEEEKEFTKKILSEIGKEIYFDDESMIDKTTAVAGSGPGFFFYIVEKWIEAAKDLGFSEVEARDLVLATVDGSNQLLQENFDVGQLRNQVTSKGGTTEAGLKVLDEVQIKSVWDKVLQASKDRAEELSR